MRDLPYRQALVTGASRGLGRAFAEALRSAGVEVWGTSRDGTRLPEGVRALALDLSLPITPTAPSPVSTPIVPDKNTRRTCSGTAGRPVSTLTTPETNAPASASPISNASTPPPGSIAALVNRLRVEAPELDLLVNNAGGGTWSPFLDFPADELERQWHVLLASPVALCRAFYPEFVERGRGAIVNVASLAGQFPIPFMSSYSAAKAGLSAFSRTLMLEAAGTGVVVIDFQPGDYATGFNDNMHKPPREALPTQQETRAWECCEEHLRNGPRPEHAARALLRALRRGRSHTVATGTFFQATLGPLLTRVLPPRIVQWYLRHYYK